MKAIESKGTINEKGKLEVEQLFEEHGKKVKVLVLIEEESEYQYGEQDGSEYQSMVKENPAFDFLKEEEEDLYSLEDGKPFKYGQK